MAHLDAQLNQKIDLPKIYLDCILVLYSELQPKKMYSLIKVWINEKAKN